MVQSPKKVFTYDNFIFIIVIIIIITIVINTIKLIMSTNINLIIP